MVKSGFKMFFFFFSSRRRHTRYWRDWSSDVCSSDLIMATNMTLAENKFNKLMSKYKDKCDIVSLPCPGLVEYIEKGIVEGEKLKEFLVEKLSILDKDKIASVVLEIGRASCRERV